MFGNECNNTGKMKYLEIFTDIINDESMMKCYMGLGLFDWWYRPNQDTLKLYVSDFQQWREIKNLIMSKYPHIKEINRGKYCSLRFYYSL